MYKWITRLSIDTLNTSLLQSVIKIFYLVFSQRYNVEKYHVCNLQSRFFIIHIFIGNYSYGDFKSFKLFKNCHTHVPSNPINNKYANFWAMRNRFDIYPHTLRKSHHVCEPGKMNHIAHKSSKIRIPTWHRAINAKRP